MKRILIALVIGAFALISCKKDHSADYVFEGYQWVSEDLAANSEFPEGRILLDVGLTKPGYLSTAYIMNEAIPGYEAGVPILMTTGKYTYDSATGVLTAGTAINSGVVTFLAADKIKYESEGTVMVFTRLDKPYKLGGQNVPFQLTAEKQSDSGQTEIGCRIPAAWSGSSACRPQRPPEWLSDSSAGPETAHTWGWPGTR